MVSFYEINFQSGSQTRTGRTANRMTSVSNNIKGRQMFATESPAEMSATLPNGYYIERTTSNTNNVARVKKGEYGETLSYDSNNRLVSVKYKDGSTFTLGYADNNSKKPSSITSQFDEDGKKCTTKATNIKYNNKGYPISFDVVSNYTINGDGVYTSNNYMVTRVQNGKVIAGGEVKNEADASKVLNSNVDNRDYKEEVDWVLYHHGVSHILTEYFDVKGQH